MLAHRNLSLLSVALMGVALCGTTAAAAEFESPTALHAKDVLPAELISSATHRVAPGVANDGFMNRFDVSLQFGALTASSSAELAKRVHELAVVAKLEQVSKSEEFAKHLQKGAERVIKGAEKLITNPVDTVTGALSGVGKLFENASESVFGVGSGDAGKMESLIGFPPRNASTPRTLVWMCTHVTRFCSSTWKMSLGQVTPEASPPPRRVWQSPVVLASHFLSRRARKHSTVST